MEATFVAGCHWYRLRATDVAGSLAGELTVTLDGRSEWTFDVSTWRPINLGATHDGGYLWSARDLIVLPRDELEDPVAIKVDEDLLFAFRLEDGWALVCESSVRRLLGQEETARWELPEVVVHAVWRDGILFVRDDAGGETRLKIIGPGLVPGSR
jgi:hypothetical protein